MRLARNPISLPRRTEPLIPQSFREKSSTTPGRRLRQNWFGSLSAVLVAYLQHGTEPLLYPLGHPTTSVSPPFSEARSDVGQSRRRLSEGESKELPSRARISLTRIVQALSDHFGTGLGFFYKSIEKGRKGLGEAEVAYQWRKPMSQATIILQAAALFGAPLACSLFRRSCDNNGLTPKDRSAFLPVLYLSHENPRQLSKDRICQKRRKTENASE